MSTNKKFRIQNGVDIHGGGLSIDDVTVIDADGKVVAAAIADAVAGLTSSDIADLQAQVSAILGTSPETLDTLQEIVAAFESADTTLTGTIAQNAADIATINTTLTNGVATPTDVADLQSQVTSNDTDIAANAAAIAAANARTAGISTSSGSSNIQMAAEVDMDSNKVTNMADPTAAQDAATKAYVDAASSTSSTDLATETAARIQGDADTLSSAQADATTKADAAEAAAIAHANTGDATVQAAVDVVSGRVDAILNGSGESLDTIVEIVAAFENADSDIQSLISSNSSSLTSEISRATAAESTLQSNIDAEESARIAADSDLQASIDTEVARATAAETANATNHSSLDAFVNGSSSTATYGVVDGNNIDSGWKDQDGNTWVGSNSGYGDGIDMYSSSDSKAYIDLPAGTHQFSWTSIGPSGLGVSLFVIPQAGDPNGNLVSQAIVKNENTYEVSSYGTPPYWEYTVTEPVKLVVTNPVLNSSAMGTGYRTFTQMSVAISTAAPSLDTTASTVVEAVNEVLAAVNSSSTASASDLAAETAARIAGDSDITASLAGETAARIAGDSSLSSAISAEESARIAADTSLSSDIVSATTLVAGDGISVDNLTHTVALDGSALEQNLVPAVDNVYTLGSPDKVWKDVYIGPGSLYIGGQKVIEDNSGTITVNADPNQNLTVQTTGTGALNVQSTGSGGVSIDAASESVSIKSNLVMSVDKTISTAGGAATKMGGDVDMQGHSVTGLGDPSAAADAATKSYVDGRIAEGTISGSKTFSDSVIITGDLTVSGTTTTVNSETISLADNIIDLNSNLTSGAPSENAGIRVMRGDESAVQVRWNETSDYWETYNGSAWTKIALSTSDLAEGSNLYFTEQRAKDCLTGGLCITYNSTTGEIKVDEAEAESSLRVAESVASDDADKLDGQEGTYYRINVYNVAGTLVN